MASTLKLEVVIGVVDRLTTPLRAIRDRITRFASRITGDFGFTHLGGALGRVREQLMSLVRPAGLIAGLFGLAGGGLAIAAFKDQFLDTAVQFERFGAILETLEGSAQKGRAALDWVSDFAQRTPYEIGEVTDAFVRLRSYGIDATKGSLKSAGNAAAAMGKPLGQAVEALADAMVGENERLKEFGISASQHGSRIVYQYTANGQTMTKRARANSRDQMRATIEAIWNEKYAGAMDKLSTTWAGMMSNLEDAWTRFKLMVMRNGVFDWLKGKLQGFLDTVNRLAASGELETLAKHMADRIVSIFKAIDRALPDVWEGLKSFGRNMAALVEMVGGWQNALKLVAVFVAGPFIASLAVAAVAVIALGNAILMTPFGWVLAGLALVAGAAYAIYKNWQPIRRFFAALGDEIRQRPWWEFILNPVGLVVKAGVELYDNWDRVRTFFLGLWDGVTERWQSFVDFVTGMWEKIKAPVEWAEKHLPAGAKPPATMEDFRAHNRRIFYGDNPPAWLTDANRKRSDLGADGGKAQAEVTVKFENMPRGARVSTKAEPGIDLGIDAGYGWGVP